MNGNTPVKFPESAGQQELLSRFFGAILQDPRIGPAHIALYAALYHCWLAVGGRGAVCAYSHEMMPVAKLSSSATYHRVLRELDKWGYLRYEPSYSRLRRSRVLLAWDDSS
ncbi:hypothetical protein [Pontibacter liquoris]|uniref:hypothetical protein n=1 Tax=Pontibacter liquoris TaxID=2905677 RepID=UPI001FA6E4DE|nr:hypothetical protein [Pontibacter liquoris]